MWSFLPYSAAEIMASWGALGEGELTEVAVPEDVQRLVDAAEVSWSDLAGDLGSSAYDLVESHLVASASKALKASARLVPSPREVADSPARSLERFCAGELDEQHFETRWSQDLRVDCLLVGDAPGCWNAELPPSPSREDVLDLLSCTVPVSGSAARAVLDLGRLAYPSEGDGSSGHPLLRGVHMLPLPEMPQFRYDPKLGLLFDKGV